MSTETRKRAAGAGEASDAKKARTDLGTREGFMGLYPRLRDEILEIVEKEHGMQEEVINWLREMMDYTVPGGKLNRGLTVVHCARTVAGGSLTAEKEEDAAILGWCIEWLQSFFLVADDVMDESVTRRGKPCWYRVPKVGSTAINDSFLLESNIYMLVKKRFAGRPEYAAVCDLFREVTLQTELGQLLDLTAQHPGQPLDLERFTGERYRQIVRYKTAFYTFYLPLALGIVVAGAADEATLSRTRAISLLMGEYFQAQDDFLDCYGDPAVIGKIGTDIQDAKCSWLVVQALQKASPEQKETLKARYGLDNSDDIQAIKDLFKALELEKAFEQYESESYAKLQELISGEADERLRQAYKDILSKIYKRSK